MTGPEMMISSLLKVLKVNVSPEEMQKCKDTVMQFVTDAPALVTELQTFQKGVLARLETLEFHLIANQAELLNAIREHNAETLPAGSTLDYSDACTRGVGHEGPCNGSSCMQLPTE